MKTIAIIFATLLACTACVNDAQTPAQVTAAIGEQFVLANTQTALLTGEELDAARPLKVQLIEVDDKRCTRCVIGHGAMARLVFSLGSGQSETRLCIDGNCYLTDGTVMRPPLNGVDSTDVRLGGMAVRVFLSKVDPHPDDEWKKPQSERQPKRATLLVKRI